MNTITAEQHSTLNVDQVNQNETQLIKHGQTHDLSTLASNMEDIRTAGMQLYQKNNALRNFANVMEHPEFSTFINEYLFRDPAAVIKLMKLYANIGQTVSDPYERLALFHAKMRDYMRGDQGGAKDLQFLKC